MFNFREFDYDGRLDVLAKLFAMVWSSAEDLARVGPHGRAHYGKQLLVLVDRCLVRRVKAGHARGAVWRYALTGLGVEFVSIECEVEPDWPNSDLGQRYLLLRMDTLEPAYSVAPALWRMCNDQIENGERQDFVDAGPFGLGVSESGTMPVPGENRITGFRWIIHPYFDAVTEGQNGRGNSKQMMIVRCGLHAREAMMPGHYAGRKMISGGFSVQTDGFQGLNFGDRTSVTGPSMYPANIIAISNQNDAFGKSLAARDYGWDPFELLDVNTVLHVDDTGRWLGPLRLGSSRGTILEPAETDRVTIPNIQLDRGHDRGAADPAIGTMVDPIFEAINGAMGARVFGAVSAHNAIGYRDIVEMSGKNDRAGVRERLNRMVDAELLGCVNDIYYLDAIGRQLAAIRDGVHPEMVAARFQEMYNGNSTVSRRWLRNQAKLAHWSVGLKNARVPMISGWRVVFESDFTDDKRTDRSLIDPDAWVYPDGALAGLVCVRNGEEPCSVGRRLVLHATRAGANSLRMLLVCETPELEDMITRHRWDTRCTAFTTTERELLDALRGERGDIWRCRGEPSDFLLLAPKAAE